MVMVPDHDRSNEDEREVRSRMCVCSISPFHSKLTDGWVTYDDYGLYLSCI